MPPHAYVPGRSPRHAEDWFDEIKSSVSPGMPVAALAETRAFHAGLIYLHSGHYWECHEVLEAVWLQTMPDTAERHMVQALIQLANARLKLSMDRPRATRRLLAMVRGHLQCCAGREVILGLSVATVHDWVEETAGRAD